MKNSISKLMALALLAVIVGCGPVGSTLSILLFLIVLVLTIVQWQLRKRWVFHEA